MGEREKGGGHIWCKCLLKTPLIVRSLETDQTLQGTVQRVDQIRASRTPGEALQVGAVTVFPIDVEVDVIDWPEE